MRWLKQLAQRLRNSVQGKNPATALNRRRLFLEPLEDRLALAGSASSPIYDNYNNIGHADMYVYDATEGDPIHLV